MAAESIGATVATALAVLADADGATVSASDTAKAVATPAIRPRLRLRPRSCVAAVSVLICVPPIS